MSSSKFAAWLRVTPPPTTLAESSAVLKHLKTHGQGRVTTFIRAKARPTEKKGPAAPAKLKDAIKEPDKTRAARVDKILEDVTEATRGVEDELQDGKRAEDEDTSSALFYTVFSRSSPLQQSSVPFEVPVYHNLRSFRDQDPFNIRGLQDRKPYPAPKTFTCHLEAADENDAYSETIKRDNPYHGSFKVAYTDWLQEVYGETGAPAGIRQGLGHVLDEEMAAREAEAAAERDKRGEHERPQRERKLKMNSLMDTWYEGKGSERPRRP